MKRLPVLCLLFFVYALGSAGTATAAGSSWDGLVWDAGRWDYPAVPTVTTSATTAVTSSTATGGGAVSDDGGAAVTARGVCWATGHDPALGGACSGDGSGDGSFVSGISGLSART